jgi:hypothetical protein
MSYYIKKKKRVLTCIVKLNLVLQNTVCAGTKRFYERIIWSLTNNELFHCGALLAIVGRFLMREKNYLESEYLWHGSFGCKSTENELRNF